MISVHKKGPDENRILMFSQRNIYEKLHFRCYLSEFEDLICQMDSVELLCPEPLKRFKYGTRIAQRLAADYSFAFNPGILKQTVDEDYELFFTFCLWPTDLLNVASIVNWENCAKFSVCWLTEIWISEIFKYRYYLDILSKFDLVVINLSSSLNAVNEVIGEKAFFMTLGIDAVLFCPYPNPPQRSIDMYSIGRRSEITHNKLLEMAKNNDIFYVYDTLTGRSIYNSLEHRMQFANMAKRSKFFMVNPGKVDIPGEVTSQSEVGNRFFEGLASGAIMVGEHPQVKAFKEMFYWPDAVAQLPYDSEDIDRILKEFERDPEREKTLREKNLVESLKRHDWLYRWEIILQKTGMDPLPGFYNRQKVLNELCNLVISQP